MLGLIVVLLIPLEKWRRRLFMYARTGGKDIRRYSYFNNLTTRDLRLQQASIQFFM